MVWLLLCLLPLMTFILLDLACGGEPPAVFRWLGRRLAPPTRQLTRGLSRRLGPRWPVRLRLRPVPARRVDAFDTLRLQSRLGAVADEILRLESDRRVFARAARLRATHRAYDDLLAEACRLADVAVVPDPRRPDDVRTTAELELASRGWSW